MGRANWQILAGGWGRIWGREDSNSDRMSFHCASKTPRHSPLHPAPFDFGVGSRGQMGRRLGWGSEEFRVSLLSPVSQPLQVLQAS